MKTIRFSTVVEKAGHPEVHTLWAPPEKDPALKKAVAGHRVMSIHSGAPTDYGTIGLIKGPQTQILIFPKSLRRFEGKRVIGIKYGLLASPTSPSHSTAPRPKTPSTSKKTRR